MKSKIRRLRGFSMVDLIMAIALIAMGVASALHFYKVAQEDAELSATVEMVNTWVVQMRAVYGPSRTYANLNNDRLNVMRLVKPPLHYNVDIVDRQSVYYYLIGNNVGAPPSFALLINGVFGSLSPARCVALARALAVGAEKAHVGNGASATAGIVSGGQVYKSISVAQDVPALTTGCAEANPKIALQYH